MQDTYNIIEHRHRFAIWAAGRAYSRQGPGHTMSMASKLIIDSGLNKIATADDLPPAAQMDEFLDGYFQSVIHLAENQEYEHKWKDEATKENHSAQRPLECSYGRAQKLVNVYLKSKLICSGAHDDDRIAALHRRHPANSPCVNQAGTPLMR